MDRNLKGRIFQRLYNKKLLFLRVISTPLVKLECRLRGVHLGSNACFWGRTYFYRHPSSKITIGETCRFRSLFHSNLIGINRPCSISTLTTNSQIIIGDQCGFSGVILGAAKCIDIGNDVLVGANTLITDNDWHFDDPRSNEPRSIVIKDHVWIGEGVKILKGVEIGENTVIGAGSIVTRDIAPNVVAAGNPCKVIRKLGSSS